MKKEFTEETGGHWKEEAQWDMLGMSSIEWSRYMHDELGVPLPPEQISSAVADRLAQQYRERLPLLPGAVEAVRSLARHWPLGLATSSNRNVIDLVLEKAGLADAFAATVSSEEVERGKPAPDVYLEAARRLEVDPGACVAIEDSTNGIRSAHAAEMAVIAVPNRDFPPSPRRWRWRPWCSTRSRSSARSGYGLAALPPDLVGQPDHPAGEGPSA